MKSMAPCRINLKDTMTKDTIANLRSISLVALIATVAFPTFGQQKDAPSPTPAQAAPATAMDCSPGMKRHDHAAEKGMGSSNMKGMPCPTQGAASTATAKSKKKPLHDHAKENKQQ